MKRSMGGGAARGPVAPTRQRRTIRFVQFLLVLFAAGLLVYAGYTRGVARGYEDARRAGDLSPPRPPPIAQTVVVAGIAVAMLGGAFYLGGPGNVRLPTPARLEELAGRAEAAALERAEAAATEPRTDS